MLTERIMTTGNKKKADHRCWCREDPVRTLGDGDKPWLHWLGKERHDNSPYKQSNPVGKGQFWNFNVNSKARGIYFCIDFQVLNSKMNGRIKAGVNGKLSSAQKAKETKQKAAWCELGLAGPGNNEFAIHCSLEVQDPAHIKPPFVMMSAWCQWLLVDAMGNLRALLPLDHTEKMLKFHQGSGKP